MSVKWFEADCSARRDHGDFTSVSRRSETVSV